MNRCNREHLVRTMADKERALIAKYYDEDGNLVKRRRTRQQAKLASCVSSIQEFEASEIHTLPDEVLLLVFSRMQSAELLPLRLVCPRWNQLVLDPTVWRRREIVVSTGDWSPQVRGVGSTDLRTAASVLYVAPTLETLEIPPVRYLRGEKLMMAALLEGRCQMRSLTCDLALRVGADVHSALFRRLQPSLVALDVGLSHGASQGGSGMAAIKRHLANALELLDDSPLERLALRGSRGYSYPINLQLQDFEFKKLETLQELFLEGPVLALDLQRNLVTLNRSTLRRVSCGSDLLPSLVQCPNLTAVTVKNCSSLDALYDLTALESVTLHLDGLQEIRAVDSFLALAREGCRLPPSVGVWAGSSTHANYLLGMRETSLRKITTLRLDLNPWEIGAVTRTLNSLRSLEALHLPSGTIFCSSWQAVDLSRLNKIFLYGSGYSQSDVTTLIKKRWPHVTYRLFPLIDRRHRDFLLL